MPPQWLHWTVQGVHHRLNRNQVEQAVEAARRALEMDGMSPTVQMGPVWPGPSAVTVAMYPEEPLARLNTVVRRGVQSVVGIDLRPAGERYWPHSTLAYYRSSDVHNADFNRRLRSIRPVRAEVTIERLHAVYMRQDVEHGYYTWEHIAALPAGGSSPLTVDERLDELCRQAQREGSELWSAAWKRARSIVGPALGGEKISSFGGHSGEEYVDGAGALAIAFYLLARERGTSTVSSISRDDVENLVGPFGYERIQLGLPQLKEVWTGRLESLGHGMDDLDDPVMVRWRALCYDHPEPTHDIDGSLYRVGHAGETGIRLLLSPFHSERIRF